MNIITRRLIMVMGPMLLKSVMNSMLEEKTLITYRDKTLAFIRGLTDKTKTEIDDNVVEAIIKMLMDPAKYLDKTKEFCALARQYITRTDNGWDDIVFLPILDRVELIGTGK